MEDQMLDIVMMRLRTADGLDLAEFAAQHGLSIKEAFAGTGTPREGRACDAHTQGFL